VAEVSSAYMNIVIITQDDPFYLGRNMEYLLHKLPEYANVTAGIVTSVSPFGRRESFLAKALRTLRVFGFVFFIRYAFRFVLATLDRRHSVPEVLKRNGVPVLTLSGSINESDSLELIRRYNPDLLISIAGNELFKKPLIELAPKGCLNLHTALLPKYRGLMPSFWVLKNGEKVTGVSVFFVDEGIDSGPILVKKEIEIGEMTQEELIWKTKRLGMDAILEAIDKLNDDDVRVMDNNDDEMTYFGFPKRQDVVDFRKTGRRFF
jgi:methionyl-tRNA formyltransferase